MRPHTLKKKRPSAPHPEPEAHYTEEEVWKLVSALISSKSSYKAVLETRGARAQDVLDLMQKMLNHPSIPDDLKGPILVATMRLCTASGTYPRCLILQQVHYEAHPVAGGGFAEIWKGYIGNRCVSLKVPKLYQSSQIEHMLKKSVGEAIMWSHLKHPNLLPFYGIYRLGGRYDRVCLVSPWMDNGDVSDYLKASPEAPRLPLVYEVLAGLGYLHKESVVHGDLKGANILVSPTGSARLADFGLSSVVDDNILRWTSLGTMTRFGGTIRWEAPELMEDPEDEAASSPRPTFQSDVYSVASVMYEILTGRVPYYQCQRDSAVIAQVVKGNKPRKPPPEPQLELSDEIWAVMEECWNPNPDERPTVDQAADKLSKISPPKLTVKRMARDQEKKRQRDEFQTPSPQTFRATVQGTSTSFSTIEIDLLKNYLLISNAEDISRTEDETWQLISTILQDASLYKTLLGARGERAQEVLGLMQKMLDHPSIPDSLKRPVLVATMRLCAASGAYPRCLILQRVHYQADPVAGGGFAEIWKGDFEGRPVALKIVRLYQRSQIDHILKRMGARPILWGQLEHPNLLPFYGVYRLSDRHDRVGLVSPWMDNGNISNYLEENPQAPRLPLVRDVLTGLEYLHKQSVVHGNLKGANILISSSGLACLADFGLSSIVDASVWRWSSLNSVARFRGMLRWEAPELMDDPEDGSSPRPTFSSDVYSVASVMYEILTGQVPYYEFPRDVTVISKVIRGIKPSRPPPELQLELSDDIWAVMEGCWNYDPTKRPTVAQVAKRLGKIPSPQSTTDRMARDQGGRRGDEFQALAPRAFRSVVQGSNASFSMADVNLLKEYARGGVESWAGEQKE